MTIAAAGHNHIVLSGKFNVVRCDFLVMVRVPALDTVNVL
jgi:hypothetical protein